MPVMMSATIMTGSMVLLAMDLSFPSDGPVQTAALAAAPPWDSVNVPLLYAHVEVEASEFVRLVARKTVSIAAFGADPVPVTSLSH